MCCNYPSSDSMNYDNYCFLEMGFLLISFPPSHTHIITHSFTHTNLSVSRSFSSLNKFHQHMLEGYYNIMCYNYPSSDGTYCNDYCWKDIITSCVIITLPLMVQIVVITACKDIITSCAAIILSLMV